MKLPEAINFTIGNISIRAFLHGFSSIGDKAGVSVHSHAEFEYHFVLYGSSVIKFDDKSISLNRNESILVYPHTFHKFSPSGLDTGIISFCFSLKKSKRGFDYDIIPLE